MRSRCTARSSASTCRFTTPVPSNVMMFSKKQWDAEGETGYERRPAGTGPYIFKERELGRYVLYERAPTPHWKHGVVDWKEIQMTWTLEEPTRFAQLLAGRNPSHRGQQRPHR